MAAAESPSVLQTLFASSKGKSKFLGLVDIPTAPMLTLKETILMPLSSIRNHSGMMKLFPLVVAN